MAHRKEGGFDLQIKLLTIGNSGVGKTCLLLRYANDAFSPTFITTIGKCARAPALLPAARRRRRPRRREGAAPRRGGRATVPGGRAGRAGCWPRPAAPSEGKRAQDGPGQ